MPKLLPPIDVIREHLIFCGDGTVILRKRSSTDSRKTGSVLGGRQSKGYLRLSLFGQSYLVHRLVFYNHYGWCPDGIDHKDGDKTNNRPDNLRPANNTQNQSNAPKHKTYKGRPTTAKLKGVVKITPSRWIAQAKIKGEQKYLGTFRTEIEAHAAYCNVASGIHGDFFKP